MSFLLMYQNFSERKEYMDITLDNNCYDEEMIADALKAEEEMTSLYNHFANKCVSVNVRSEFLNLLNDEHQLQMEIADEMRKRNWCLPG